MSSESGLDDPQELADEVPTFNNSVNVSEFLKSANRLNKSLNTTASRSEGTNSRLSNYRSKQSFEDNMENMEPAQLAARLKQQLHESHKRQANQRLQLSRLKNCVDHLTKESQQLRQELLHSEVKITKNNEYILKLDNQLRVCREEIDRYRKQHQSLTRQQQDYSKLEQENKEMRFVIEELLRQLEERETQQQSHRNSLDKRQNITELMKDLRTYPSSESSRGSTHKPQCSNVFEFTMNPRGQHNDQYIVPEQRPNEQQQPENEQQQEPSLNERIRLKVLSVIHEDMDDGCSKAPTDQYIRSRINELASLNQSVSCGRSFMYGSNDS